MFKGIISIILLIAAVGVFFVLLKPLYNDVKELDAKKVSFEEALADTRQIQETRDQLLSKYNTISQDNIGRLDEILPSQPGAMKFILEIENIAQRNGVIMKKIDFKEQGEATEKNNFKTITESWETVPFSVKLSGSYKSFYSFIKDMGKNLRLTDINIVNFSSGEKDFYEFTVDGSFYWKKEKDSQPNEILAVLSLLGTINLNLDFFSDPVFTGLYDFSVKLPASETGKNNPFAP